VEGVSAFARPHSPGSSAGKVKRRLSPMGAVAILVIVLVVLAIVGLVVLQSIASTSEVGRSSSPPYQCPGCCTACILNDVRLYVPIIVGYGSPFPVSIPTERTVSATVSVIGGETIRNFTAFWGDGSNSTDATGAFVHTYGQMGLFVISGTALDTHGAVHTGLYQLVPVVVSSENRSDALAADIPTIRTTFDNGSAGGGIYPWAVVGSRVTVNASYASEPANPQFRVEAPVVRPGSGVTEYTESNGAEWASGEFTLQNIGTDTIVFAGDSTNGTTTVPFSFTWAVYVAPSSAGLGCALCGTNNLPSSDSDPSQV